MCFTRELRHGVVFAIELQVNATTTRHRQMTILDPYFPSLPLPMGSSSFKSQNSNELSDERLKGLSRRELRKRERDAREAAKIRQNGDMADSKQGPDEATPFLGPQSSFQRQEDSTTIGTDKSKIWRKVVPFSVQISPRSTMRPTSSCTVDVGADSRKMMEGGHQGDNTLSNVHGWASLPGLEEREERGTFSGQPWCLAHAIGVSMFGNPDSDTYSFLM